MVGDLPGRHRITVGGDKAYDTREFVQSLRGLNAVPHVAQNRTGRSSAIDGRTTRYPGYTISQRLRKRVEEIFGWIKTVGNLRKTRHRDRFFLDDIVIIGYATRNLHVIPFGFNAKVIHQSFLLLIRCINIDTPLVQLQEDILKFVTHGFPNFRKRDTSPQVAIVAQRRNCSTSQ